MENNEITKEITNEIAFPVLLRHARGAYGMAIAKALAAVGFDDIPKNGHYVIGGLAVEEVEIPLSQLIKELRTSKQAAGQLVDTLVLRGYLDRKADPNDRRKLSVTLTERGRAVAEVQRKAIREVDAELQKRVTPEEICHARKVLHTLIQMNADHDHEASTQG